MWRSLASRGIPSRFVVLFVLSQDKHIGLPHNVEGASAVRRRNIRRREPELFLRFHVGGPATSCYVSSNVCSTLLDKEAAYHRRRREVAVDDCTRRRREYGHRQAHPGTAEERSHGSRICSGEGPEAPLVGLPDGE